MFQGASISGSVPETHLTDMKKYYIPITECTDLTTIRPMMTFDGTGTGSNTSGDGQGLFGGGAPKREVF